MGKAPSRTIASPEDAVSVIPGIGKSDHEEVWVLFLTSSNTVISKEMVSMGTLTQTSIDCRTILRRVLLNNALGIILVHNHPSGNPKPSKADIKFTERLKEACTLMDIRLIDHIVESENSYYSFSDETVRQYDK